MRSEDRPLFEPFSYVADEPHAVDVEDVIATRSGVLFQGVRILPGSFPPYPRLFPRMSFTALASRARRPVVSLPSHERYLLVHNIWSGGFYHWMTESLVKLDDLWSNYRDSIVLLPSHTSLSRVLEQSVRFSGFERIAWYPSGANVRVHRGRFSRNTLRQAHYHPERIHRVRERLLSSARVEAEPRDLIYVSRAGASRRKIVNEDEVLSVVQRRGFRAVSFEQLDFEQQIATMAKARAVISIHGAGLTNAMFMHPGAKLLELYKTYDPRRDVTRLTRTRGPSICYRRLAAVFGLDYYIQFCRPTKPADVVDVADLHVDVERLQANLDLMLS